MVHFFETPFPFAGPFTFASLTFFGLAADELDCAWTLR